ncbi:hypothetical protein BJ165DRAFT_233319 [Panaeolus papilionaceus]|nr:hypothetical protein BJ165DRAFT_233319 [Panaeolus papilionaceus]
MTTTISTDLKHCMVRWYHTDEMTMEEIRDLSGCSIGTVYDTLRNFEMFGQATNPFSRRSGRPSSLSAEDIKFLQSLLDANPSLYLDEL